MESQAVAMHQRCPKCQQITKTVMAVPGTNLPPRLHKTRDECLKALGKALNEVRMLMETPKYKRILAPIEQDSERRVVEPVGSPSD